MRNRLIITMQDLEPYEIFQIELTNCETVDGFYGAAALYFEITGGILWDIFSVMSNYERSEDQLQYVENYVFADDLIKQDMVMLWFNTFFGAHPEHQKIYN